MPTVEGGFAAGFVTALGLLMMLGLMLQGVQYIHETAQPTAAVVEYVTTPMFSIMDVLNVLLVLLTIALVYGMLVWRFNR
jgi:hypothetical protein